MLKYIGRRLLMMIPVMLGVILIVFTLMYITPGDPVDTLLGDDATPEMAEQLREELGLNGTYIERLGKYLVLHKAACHGPNYPDLSQFSKTCGMLCASFCCDRADSRYRICCKAVFSF